MTMTQAYGISLKAVLSLLNKKESTMSEEDHYCRVTLRNKHDVVIRTGFADTAEEVNSLICLWSLDIGDTITIHGPEED